jgi:hypothetical protein
MDLNISLNQGIKFKKYQNRIKKHVEKDPMIKDNVIKSKNKNGNQNTKQNGIQNAKEGFINVFEINAQNVANTKIQNAIDLKNMQNVDNQLNQLVQQSTTLETSNQKKANDLFERYGPNNPYKGKNVRLTGSDAMGYVTQMGEFKWYPNWQVISETAGKNGCPALPQENWKSYVTDIQVSGNGYNIPGTTIDSNPSLVVGTPMASGQMCGNEGQNVYVDNLLSNPKEKYVGCYNDKPQTTMLNIVPKMGPSNTVNNFNAYSSSVYQNNNNFAGPWCAFDQNSNTWWHSDPVSGHLYNENTGMYEGTVSIDFTNKNNQPTQIKGEILQINMPNEEKYYLTSYELQGRQDCCGSINGPNPNPNGRNPNTWYILGWKEGIWHEVDYQANQNYGTGLQSYSISNPDGYSAYMFVTTVCGDQNNKGNRSCVQIAAWNLFTVSDYSFKNENRAMLWNPDAIGYTTLDNCKTYAADNGYKYFGMQDIQSNGTAACLLSNDLTSIQKYGQADANITGVPLWSSNTYGSDAKYAMLSDLGRFIVMDGNSTVLWQNTNIDPADCANQYGMTPNTDAGGNDIQYYANVTADKCKELCNENDGCAGFAFDTISNSACWIKTSVSNTNGNDNTTLYTRVKPTAKCSFVLVLQDDGNMCIYKGTPQQYGGGAIWCSMTNSQQQEPNPDWTATKGKNGVNYLVGGQSLGPNEWIGSNNGTLKLIMQEDGNLVLYTSTVTSGCQTNANGKIFGKSWVNAVYENNAVGDPSLIGKVGYVDGDANLREYPSSMIGKSKQYDLYNGYDSFGNDLGGFNTNDMNACMNACNANDECAAFVWQPGANVCYPKNNNAFPKGQRQVNPNLTLAVRRPAVIGSSSSCAKDFKNIDTIEYSNYFKGSPMDSTSVCGPNIMLDIPGKELSNVYTELNSVSGNIVSNQNGLYTDNININNTMINGEKTMTNNVKDYKQTKTAISSILGKQKESMLNMQDLNAMISDSDLIVLQNNYQYILWSILALGTIIITVNAFKK